VPKAQIYKGAVKETIHDSNYFQGTHSLLLRSARTSSNNNGKLYLNLSIS